jgi:hypothetical protein
MKLIKTVVAITFTSLMINTAIAKPRETLAMLTLTTGTIPIFASHKKGDKAMRKKVTRQRTAQKQVTRKKKSRGRRWSCISNIDVVKDRARELDDIILKSSLKHAVDANLIKAVIAVESCYNRKAVSPAGAQGLMQLIPATADRFGVSDSFNASQNINAGTRYLRFLLKRYDGDLEKATAAYNAGEGKVDRYKGIPPYKETRNYVKNVLRIYGELSGQATLFALSTVKTNTVNTRAVKHTLVNRKASSYRGMSRQERDILRKIRSLGVQSGYKKGAKLGGYKQSGRMGMHSRLSPRKQRKLKRLKELQRKLRVKRIRARARIMGYASQ